ncbi:hypothetical protein F2P79_023960 [Pimephales promelas]|nr:hypothetical protein F2P79_023960 [Pimephales promelas]
MEGGGGGGEGVCYKSWHKKCYVKHNVNITEPLPVVCEEKSSSEVASSEEEYVPDSTADSNSSWDSIAEPLTQTFRITEF